MVQREKKDGKKRKQEERSHPENVHTPVGTLVGKWCHREYEETTMEGLEEEKRRRKRRLQKTTSAYGQDDTFLAWNESESKLIYKV